jgi:dipeptidyl aminopeptidase/acylaminoacyl peptidase
MHQRSPINLVGQKRAAALLVAGKRDRVVGFEQTERYITKAKDLGKNIDSLIFENEGHGIDKWQSKIKHARRAEGFLAEHLDRRNSNWDWINPSPPIWIINRRGVHCF